MAETNRVKHFNLGGTQIDIGEYDDTAIRADLTAETSNRTKADDTLQKNIDAEANTRSTKDTELQQNINTQKARIDKAYNVSYDATSETITFRLIS